MLPTDPCMLRREHTAPIRECDSSARMPIHALYVILFELSSLISLLIARLSQKEVSSFFFSFRRVEEGRRNSSLKEEKT